MRNVLLRAWLISLGLFGLFRWSWIESHAVGPLTLMQGRWAEALFGASAQPIVITLACSAADVVALCCGAILSYPAAWRRRWAGVGGGLAVILGLNVLRIGTLGRMAGDPAAFNALHLYIWPAGLVLAVAGYVFWWMRGSDRKRPEFGVTTRFIVLAAVLLAAFVAAAPFYLESAAVLRVGAWIARIAAAMLRVCGVDATASLGILVIPNGAFAVTQECLSTPLIPIYIAAVIAYARSWPQRIVGLAVAFPLFVALGLARLLVVALPVAGVASPMFLVHAFFQLLLGATLIVLAAIWRAGGLRRAAMPAAAGLTAGIGLAWLAAHSPMPAWQASALGAMPDSQGAIAFAPVFQIGLYGGLWIAGIGWSAPRRAIAGVVLLLVAEAAFVAGLRYLGDAGLLLHVREVRGWALAVPLLIFVVLAGPMRRRAGSAADYRHFWHDVGGTFPDLGAALSTEYYRDNERRLFTEHLAPLDGLRVFKTDLWDEAKNTRILQWAASEGAVAYGIDISRPIVALVRANDGGHAIRAVTADVRRIPFADASFDAVYSMGTIEHFDETEEAVAEIFRVLKPGGRAIVGVPNRFDPFLRAPMVAAMQAVGMYGYGFEKSYSRPMLRRMLERAGFVVRAETAILFIPGWLRMLDLACHAWCPPFTPITRAMVRPFIWLDRHVPAVRKHGYLLATVVEKSRT